MTKSELRASLAKHRVLDDQFKIVDGQDCHIVKAERFSTGDEIIYVPDFYLNGISFGVRLDDEDIEAILRSCYTGNDFLDECGGDAELAERLFDYCDWQHPSSALPEIDCGGESN